MAEAALRAVALADTPLARDLLREELRSRVRDASIGFLALNGLSAIADPPRYIGLGLESFVRRSRGLAFRTLELLEESSVMRIVDRALRYPSSRTASDALEVLANLGDRKASELLILLLEDRPAEEKIPEIARNVPEPNGLEGILEWAQASVDPWLRMASTVSEPGAERNLEREEHMERLLILRSVPLFADFTLDQLDAINQIIDEVPFHQGDVLMRENDLGGDLYILIEGAANVFKNYESKDPVLLGTIRPVEIAGEMSSLDGQPRSATLVAAVDSRTLRIGSDRFKDLILRIPEMSFAIFKILSTRLREADQLIAEQTSQLRRLGNA